MFDRNLLIRSITASILFAIAISLILSSNAYFIAGVCAITAIACWEWANLAGYRSIISKIIYSIALFIGCLITYTIAARLLLVPHIMLGACIGWLLAIVITVSYPSCLSWSWLKILPRWISLYLLGIWLIAPFTLGLIILKFNNVHLLFFMLAIVWAMDIGAYVIGKKYGKHKLMPQISPGKSYQGLAGGIACAAITIGVFSYVVPDLFTNWWLATSYALLVCILSVAGDFFESLIKRIKQVKDSGSLLAGHGGMLDRVDSLTIAVPLFLLIFLYS